MKKQHIKGVDFRADTGPLKIGRDWCGLFIRGDHTDRLRSIIESHPGLSDKAKKEWFELIDSTFEVCP